MTVEVEMVLHSESAETGKQIATMVGRWPRNIHAEFMTHRVFSRNASSSRAIPMTRMHQSIQEDPAYPEQWTLNQPGMQGYQLADEDTIARAKMLITQHRQFSVQIAEQLAELGLHKQIVNRYTEAHQHIRVVFTSTEWDNFIRLRTDATAEPTMQELGRQVDFLLAHSAPQILQRGEWHLPFFDFNEFEDYICDLDLVRHIDGDAFPERIWQSFPPYSGTRSKRRLAMIAVSAARCARTSFQNFEGKRSSVGEDIDLFKKLIVSQPIHASPLEHQATPDWRGDPGMRIAMGWLNPHQHGNLVGWRQARKFIPGESGVKG